MLLDELRLILRTVRRHAPACYPGLVAAVLGADDLAQACDALTGEARAAASAKDANSPFVLAGPSDDISDIYSAGPSAQPGIASIELCAH
jgi:hypothetical protein